jgi:hypothetical protein
LIDETIANIILVISGFGSGLYVGIASGTAGFILIPTLTIFLSYSIHKVIGTSLIVDFIIGAIAGLIFLKHGKVKIKPTILLVITGVLGAFIGSQFTSETPEAALNLLIGLFLLGFGINFAINGIQKNIDFFQKTLHLNRFKEKRTPLFILMGIIVGLASGYMGMGSSGTVTIILLFILGYDLHTAIGTSLLIMPFIAGSGAFGHYLNNEVILSVALIVGISAAIGASTGSIFANKIDENKLGRIYGILITFLGIVIIGKMFL